MLFNRNPVIIAKLYESRMDHRILFGILITILLSFNGVVVGDQDEDIPHNE